MEGGQKTVDFTVEQMLSRAALKTLKTREGLKLLEGHCAAGRAVGGYSWAERVPLGWGAWAGAPRVTVLEATVEAWYKSCR